MYLVDYYTNDRNIAKGQVNVIKRLDSFRCPADDFNECRVTLGIPVDVEKGDYKIVFKVNVVYT